MTQNLIWIVLGIVLVFLLISLVRRRGHGRAMGDNMNPIQGQQETVRETAKVNETGTDNKTSGRGCGCC